MDGDQKRRHALEYSLAQRPELARRLLDDPAGVLDELGAVESDLACTDDAHAAVDRGAIPAAELTRIGASESLLDTLSKVSDVLGESLGQDFGTEKIPFGIRFKERVQPSANIATATVECTFGFSCHPDVDE